MITRPQVLLATRSAIENLYALYAELLDEGRYDDWLGCFAETCTYAIVPRENADRGLPLATMSFESKGMLRDRIYGITQTLFHEPYYQRHLISGFVVTNHPDGGYGVGANYAVFRTKAGSLSEVYSVGRFRDRVVVEHGELVIADKLVIFDSELIPNSLIYPL